MKRVCAIAIVLTGIFVSRPAVASGGAGFASASPAGTSGAHGGARSATISSSARNGGAARASSFSARTATRGGAPAFRFASTSAREGDPYRFFAPGSVRPLSHGGFVAGGFNGPCFAGHPAWNGRRWCFPFRFGSRFYGNGLGYAYLGSDYYSSDCLGSDYENGHRHRREMAVDPPPEYPMVASNMTPAPVSPPAAVAAPPAVVSHEFAYGAIVSEVQSRLAGDGFFRGSIDGYISSGTRTAIAMFQDSHQLVITGRIDAALLQALGLKPHE